MKLGAGAGSLASYLRYLRLLLAQLPRPDRGISNSGSVSSVEEEKNLGSSKLKQSSLLSPPVYLNWTGANFLTCNPVCSCYKPAFKSLLNGYEEEDHAGTPVVIVNNNIYSECDKVLDGVWIFGHHYTFDLGWQVCLSSDILYSVLQNLAKDKAIKDGCKIKDGMGGDGELGGDMDVTWNEEGGLWMDMCIVVRGFDALVKIFEKMNTIIDATWFSFKNPAEYY